jgi:hypothetical protein
MILAAILLSLTVEYGGSPPSLSPAICANVRRVLSGGFQATQETWVSTMRIPAGMIIRPGRIMVEGRDLVTLIEVTCNLANS